MLNIITERKFIELGAEVPTTIGGEYKVSIVDTNRGNVEFFPFGDTWHKNLILNRGLESFIVPYYVGIWGNRPPSLSKIFFTNSGNGIFWGASTGTSAAAVVATQTGLQGTLRQTSTTNVVGSGLTIDDMVTGSRSMQVATQFAATAVRITDINEAVINSAFISSQSATPFSRFVFPSTITLEIGQYLIITYRITGSIPSIVTDIPVSVSSNGFDASGTIRTVGTYDNLFGGIDANGGSGIMGSCYPYVTSNYPSYTNVAYSGTSYMLSATAAFPAAGSALSTSAVGTGVSMTASGNLYATPYVSGSKQSTINLMFPAGNPAATTNIGGILLNGTNGTSYGTMWKFNTPQAKDAGKVLVASLTYSFAAA